MLPKVTIISCIILLAHCFVVSATVRHQNPVISSVQIVNTTLINNSRLSYLLKLQGNNFYGNMTVRITSNSQQSNQVCNFSVGSLFPENNVLTNKVLNETQSYLNISLTHGSNISGKHLFLCIGDTFRTSGLSLNSNDRPIRWIHQGSASQFELEDNLVYDYDASKLLQKLRLKPREKRKPREVSNCSEGAAGCLSQEPSRVARQSSVYEGDRARVESHVELYGLRLESSSSSPEFSDEGVPRLLVNTQAVFRVFGRGWTDDTLFVLSGNAGNKGDMCEFPVGQVIKIDVETKTETTALIQLSLPFLGQSKSIYYMCTKENRTHGGPGGVAAHSSVWVHLGQETFLQIEAYEKFIPFWLAIVIIVTCLAFSSLFSGLNLGLMSLNRTDLKIICNTGTEHERKYAKIIIPVREHGNYLLCSILLGNVMVNSSFTILLDDITSGLVAIIGSTLAIVIFGEISPQAICSRHGLMIGAKTIMVTKIVMVLTFPLAYPISKILDWVLGEEIGNVYTRERLKELVKATTEFNDLENDEVNIISGALELRRKIVGEVMTKLEDVYMLSYDAILDFETVSEIMKSGYSRIPVFEDRRTNIVTMLYIKDLALVDPDDNTPLKTLCQFYQNSCYFVFEDTTLDVLLKQFKEGIKGHMAFVHRVNNEGEGDPFYETVGLITLEDVIEELIQAEIMDETDVWTDNQHKTKRRNQSSHRGQDFTVFAEKSEAQRIHISPQLNLATFQFLSSSVDPFKTDTISETVLMRLLKQDVIHHIKIKKDTDKDDPATIIYHQNKPVDHFVLILEGRAQVTVGKENLVYEAGPFSYFGCQALTQNIGVAESPTNNTSGVQGLGGSLQSVNLDSILRYTFVPDYSVRATTEMFYVKIRRSFYLAAKRATLMEKSKKSEESMSAGDQFEDEVEKLLHSYANENNSRQISPEHTGTSSNHRNYPGSGGHSSPVDFRLNNGSLHTAPSSLLVSPSTTRHRPQDLTGDPAEKVNLIDHTSAAYQMAPMASPDPS
uniref:Metal transporter CNNM2 n=1 Tax=Cacopsylla melanoneura TaxID=428564 RepID=A0A8D8YKD0_9HEMI